MGETTQPSGVHAAARGRRSRRGLVLASLLLFLTGSALAWAAVDRAQTEAEAERAESKARAEAAVLAARHPVANAHDDARRYDRATYRARIRAGAISRHLRRTARGQAREASVWQIQYALVEPGETLDAFALRYQITPSRLMELNDRTLLAQAGTGSRLVVYRFDPDAPPASVGLANRGRLARGVPMPEGDAWVIRDRNRSWGTEVMVDAMVRGFAMVAEEYPDTPPVFLGDLSRRTGGRFPPHKSHQSGRDLDGAYYHLGPASRTASGFVHVSASTLDVERQWALFRFWIERGDVTNIFVDRRLIPRLRAHARAIGEEEAMIERAFGGPGRRVGILSHEPGHLNHFHARFRCGDRDRSCRDR